MKKEKEYPKGHKEKENSKKDSEEKNIEEKDVKSEEESGLEEDIEEAEEETGDEKFKEFIHPIIMPKPTSPVLEKIKIPKQESSLEQDVSSIILPKKEESDFRKYEADVKYSDIKYEGEGSKYHAGAESQSSAGTHSQINNMGHIKSKRKLPSERDNL